MPPGRPLGTAAFSKTAKKNAGTDAGVAAWKATPRLRAHRRPIAHNGLFLQAREDLPIELGVGRPTLRRDQSTVADGGLRNVMAAIPLYLDPHVFVASDGAPFGEARRREHLDAMADGADAL